MVGYAQELAVQALALASGKTEVEDGMVAHSIALTPSDWGMCTRISFNKSLVSHSAFLTVVSFFLEL